MNVEEEVDEADVAVGIPGYWAQCLVNHPAIEDICTHEGTRDTSLSSPPYVIQSDCKMLLLLTPKPCP